MFENPFAVLSGAIPPIVMQIFVILMIVLVAGGTLFDIVHKKSAKYFFNEGRKAKEKGIGAAGPAIVKTVASEVLTSSEFCNPRRRIAHLLTMYGFVLYVLMTVIMVFGYPTTGTPTPAIIPVLWVLGSLMVCAGGYWFWFFIRVDVAAEGNSPFRIIRADLFILSLLASATFGLLWFFTMPSGTWWAGLFFVLYLIATLVLFGSVPWSKFSHMFYKPAAAAQKRRVMATGTYRNLPPPADMPAKFGKVQKQTNHY